MIAGLRRGGFNSLLVLQRGLPALSAWKPPREGRRLSHRRTTPTRWESRRNRHVKGWTCPVKYYPLPGRVPEFQNARETGRVHQARGLYPGVPWAHERCGIVTSSHRERTYLAGCRHSKQAISCAVEFTNLSINDQVE